MPGPDILFYLSAEVAILLLVICVFLIVHVGRLKKLIGKLEHKILQLRQSVGESRREAREALKKLAEQDKVKPRTFLDYLDEEIEQTRQHHESLQPDRDIVLDITPDAPIERQASSLRHAFLIAEKEARHAGDDDQSSWDVLQSKLQQIIEFYASLTPEQAPPSSDEPAADDRSEEIDNYKKRIENLERFKKLFFDMESKWEEAKNQAEEYQKQLLEMGKDLGAGEDFENMLEEYARSFNDIEEMISAGVEGREAELRPGGDVEIEERRPSVGKMVIANQEEMQRLRNMAVDQHKVITQLKRQLYDAKSAEDKEQVIESLSTQLEKQERFLKEAETCTQLLEDELSRTMQENQELRRQLEETDEEGAEAEELERLQGTIEELTEESREMLGTIATLEKENQKLKENLDAGGGSGEEEAELREKLEQMQQELLNLQTQHIELEERYLELKSQ